MLVVFAFDAAACAGCVYERELAHHWQIKYLCVSFLVPLLVCANHLDVVRLGLVLIPYVAFSYKFYYFMLVDCYAESWYEWIFQLVWFFNLVGVALLCTISLFPFFRRNKAIGLAFWQPIAYAVATALAQYAIR